MTRQRDLEQVVCLESFAGQQTMWCFDRLPPRVRQRLRCSPFNLCSACLADRAGMWGEQALLECIEIMEAKVKETDNG